MNEELSYPMRINRYLAHEGFSTRRGADLLITKRLVKINGIVATLGAKVMEKDLVEVEKTALIKNMLRYRYVAYHKPRGITTDPQKDTVGIVGGMPALRGLFPLGRLDKDSHGLLILTNDGRLTDRLLHPNHAHEKEYVVHVNKPVTDKFIRHLGRGINIEGYRTKPAIARRAGETVFRIILTEGKKHQVRRMCAREGFQVESLARIRIMNIKLGNIKEGGYRTIENTELAMLLKKIGL
jgi:23S rRNA pseudouridine2604 synthase